MYVRLKKGSNNLYILLEAMIKTAGIIQRAWQMIQDEF